MRRLLAFLLGTLLVLSGCADSAEDLPDPSWEEYQQGQSSADQPEEAEPELPAAFSLAYHKDRTLNPITCGEGLQQDVSALLYETLFQLDTNFEPVPLLCESYSWDETGLVCTLTIREGVLFSDGTNLTAADAAASLRAAAASERYGYRLRQIVSITSNRNRQVILTLSAPNQGLISLLDIPVIKSGTENQTVPTGTGPYLFVTGSDGNYLLANDDWWQAKPLPVSSIPLVHAKDQDTAVYLFSSRRVELLTLDPAGDQISSAGQTVETDRPTTIFQYIGFNTASGVFADAAARSAFSLGLQREMLADALLSGHALPAQFPISPLSPLYPSDLEIAYSYEDTLAALTAAGQNTGENRELILLVNEDNPFRLANAKFIAESLSLLDWHITVQALPWEDYLLALANGEFDLYYGEVRLTADWDLSDLVGTGGTMNYGGYTNEETDALLLAFAGSDSRQDAARQLCAHLQRMAPIAPLCFRSYVVTTHPSVVDGLSPSASSTFHALDGWTIHLS